MQTGKTLFSVFYILHFV